MEASDAARGPILDRIAKLMALSESSNPHEAALALQRAHELMQKHHVEQRDIDLKDVKNADSFSKGKMPWERTLGAACGKAFGTVATTLPGRPGLRFTGRPVDVLVSIATFESLRLAALRMASGSGRSGDPSYLLGYAVGIWDGVKDLDEPEFKAHMNLTTVKTRDLKLGEGFYVGQEDGSKVRIGRNQLGNLKPKEIA